VFLTACRAALPLPLSLPLPLLPPLLLLPLLHRLTYLCVSTSGVSDSL
jgi:hypothetical protein